MIQYGDTIRLIKVTVDGYGNEVFDEEADVPAIFEQNTGWLHNANQSAITSDAIARVDPTNQFVQDNAQRLEGMIVVATLFGSEVSESFYRVTSATVSRDTQLSNEIDNVELALTKTAAISGVS